MFQYRRACCWSARREQEKKLCRTTHRNTDAEQASMRLLLRMCQVRRTSNRSLDEETRPLILFIDEIKGILAWLYSGRSRKCRVFSPGPGGADPGHGAGRSGGSDRAGMEAK